MYIYILVYFSNISSFLHVMLNARAHLHFMRFFSACSKCLIKVLVSCGSRYIISPIDMLHIG